MGARSQASDEGRAMRRARTWWILLFCLSLVCAGGASASVTEAEAQGANAPPVAKDNEHRVMKGTTLRISSPGVLRNDLDPDGDQLTAARVSSPRHGRLTLRGGGSFVYKPDEGYRGKDSFTYRATDPSGASDTATVEITVWSPNRLPLARNNAYAVGEDGTLTVPAPGVLGNDAEADGRRLSATKVTDPRHGSLSLDRAGSFAYTPEKDFSGEDSFVYRATDNRGRNDKGTVTIAVGGINDAPVFTGAAANTSQTIDEGAELAALETTDADGDTLSFELTGGSLPPGITLGSGGGFTGVAGGRAAGDYAANIKVSDGDGETDTTDLAVTVNAVEEAAVAQDIDVTTDEDVAKTITLTATDADTDSSLTFSVGEPGHGSLGTASAPDCATSAGTSTCTTTVLYTPDADFNGPDSFTYTAGDSAQATVSITVSSVNDEPVARADDKSTPENTPLVFPASDLVANDSRGAANEDAQTLTVTEVKNPQHGTVVLDNGEITFTPTTDYNGPAGFDYTVCDSGSPQGCSTQTAAVDVTVSPVNSKPTASATPATLDIDEDAAAQTVALAGADTETGAANLRFTITDAPAHGTLKKDTTTLGDGEGFTGSPTDVTYRPDAEYNGPDSFGFEVTDRGDPDNCGASGPACDAAKDSDTQTVPITVHPVNDAPSFDLGTDQTVVNTAGAQTVTDFATNILAGPPNESGQTLTFTVTNTDNSLFSVQPEIDETSGDLTFTPDSTASGTATVTVALTDDGGTTSGGQDTTTKTFEITVRPPNAAPVAAPQSVSTNEDTAKTIALSASDDDGDDPLTFAKGTAPTGGSLGAIGAVTCSQATPNVCTADVTYTPDADHNGPDSFTFTANDGLVDSAPATVSVTVDAVNDAPKLENTEAGAVGYTENDPATAITSATTASDIDSANFDTGTLTVDYTTGGTADDRLEIRNEGTGAGQIGVSGSNLTFDGTTIGSFTGGSGTTPLVVTLSANADATATQALVRNITYQNVSDNPSTATRTVRFVLTDGDGGTSAPVNRNVSVTAVNDAPSLAGIEGTTVDYVESVNSPPSESQLTNTLTVADADSANLSGATVQLTTACQSGEDVLAFTNQNGISGTYTAGSCTLTLSGSSSPANYQTALRSVKYKNTSDTPNTTTRTVTLKVDDGQAQNHESNSQARDITVTASNDAPVADNETFDGTNSAVGNTTLIANDPSDGAPSASGPKKTITGDILDGDTDVDGPGPLEVVAGTFATNDGGSVTIESDGDFTYVNDPADSCADTSDFFDYTVTDKNPETAGTDTGQVNVSISGCVWYVNNNASGNSGISTAPFDTLAQAQTASGTGHSIFVFDGNNTTTGYGAGIDLKANQKLIGEAANLVIGSYTLNAADTTKRPTITDNDADVVALDDANEVRGVELDPQGTGGGIAGASGDTGGATIDDVRIIDTGAAGAQPGLELDSTAGTFNVSNLTLDNTAATSPPGTATGVRLNNAGTVNFASAGSNSINVSGARGLDVLGTSMGTNSVIDGIIVSNSGSGGVRIGSATSPVTGTTTLGDGAGTDLSLTTTSGSAAAFELNTAGTVNVGSAGGDDVHATGGPVIDITGTSSGTYEFDDVDSTNSAGDGINLDSLGTGTFSATSGDIGGYSGTGFDLNGGSGAITYPGNFNNGTGTLAVDVTGRTAGAISFSGPFNDTSDAGGGINVAGNTGGSTTLSNATKQFNTGTGDGVVFNNSDGHTLNLTGGSLDIDTTGGKGLEAATSGTLNVSGSANTINTTTGRALNVTNTDIGAGGLTFQSISANGAPNGIVLNDTGTSGGLSVTGDGSTANSGGIIQNTAGPGGAGPRHPSGQNGNAAVMLTNTANVSLKFMKVLTPKGNGILADDIKGTGNVIEKSVVDYNNTVIPNAFGMRWESYGTSADAALTLDATTFQNKGDGTTAVSLSAMGQATNGSKLTFNVKDSNTGDSFESKYTNLFGSGIVVGSGDTTGSTARVAANVSDTKFVNAWQPDASGNPTTGGLNNLEFGVQASALLDLQVTNNTFDDVARPLANAGVINVNSNDTGQLGTANNPARIAGNTVRNVGIQNASFTGGYIGMRLGLQSNAPTTHRVVIANNQLLNLINKGILLSSRDKAIVNARIDNTTGAGNPSGVGNTIGTVALPVGQNNHRAIDVDASDTTTMNLSVQNNPSIVGDGSSSANSALSLTSGIVNNTTSPAATFNATVAGNVIKNVNATAGTGGRFRARTIAPAGGANTSNMCLDLRNNQLEDGSKTFVLEHGSTGTFSRNTSGNTGSITQSGTFSTVGSCPQPDF